MTRKAWLTLAGLGVLVLGLAVGAQRWSVDDRADYETPLLVETGVIKQAFAANDPPIADAGPAQTVAVGVTATLDGSGSIEPEGSKVSYAWTITAAPAGSAAALSDRPDSLIGRPSPKRRLPG